VGVAPNALQVAQALLDDVAKGYSVARQRSASSPSRFLSDTTASLLVDRDLAAVNKELDRAAAAGIDVSGVRAAALLMEGRIARAVMDSRERSQPWWERAVRAIKASGELVPSAVTTYELGQAYVRLGMHAEAILAFGEAKASGDPNVAVEAAKAISRLE